MAEPQSPVLDTSKALPIIPLPAEAAPRDGAMNGHGAGEVATGRPSARPRPRARTWILAVILVVIGAAVLYTVRYFNYAGAHPTTDDAYVQGDTTIISAKISGRVSR